MNFKKIDILLGMKNIQRLPNTPHHKGYNLFEHSFVVGALFRWFASAEDVSYDINVFEKVLLHDYVESITGDLNHTVKNFSEKTKEAWRVIEGELASGFPELQPHVDEGLKESLSPLQYSLFKMCDYLDLWIFCQQEIALGNTSKKILECSTNCERLMKDISNDWGKFNSIKKFMDRYDA